MVSFWALTTVVKLLWKFLTLITGSALALHCCKAHNKIDRKIENSTPYKIVTHADFNLKLGTRDYVADATHHATLGSNRPSGVFTPNRGNITLLWLFCYTVFFSILPPGRTVALTLTPNGSNDVFPPKEVPFGGQDDRWRHMGKIFPKKTPQKGAWTGSFKPKRPNLYITISPELLLRRSSDLRTEYGPRKALRGGPPLPQSKYNMADGRHLKNRYDVIFQRRKFRFGRNSAAGWWITCRLRKNGRDRNRK